MFVTLSCSGLPDQSTCTFTPQNIQILPNATKAVTSSLVIATSLGRQSLVVPVMGRTRTRLRGACWCRGRWGWRGLLLERDGGYG